MFHSQKPYTAVTVYVERLTGPEYEENDLSGLVGLIEAIQLQSTGPTEAARALRKKLKYGETHRQLRALTILDGLINNAGPQFQRSFADEPLLERLRLLPGEYGTDQAVREKCNQLFREWAAQFKGQPGLGGIANLYKEVPKKTRIDASRSRVVQENERDLDRGNPFADDEDDPAEETARRKSSLTPMPGSSSSPIPFSRSSAGRKDKDKDRKNKNKRKPFMLEKEKTNIMQSIASANAAATNLLNSLQFINRETQRVSESREVVARFDDCKLVRRQVLRYIQLVESDQFLGSLLSANDELVKALMAYEVMDKSIDDDSDSEDDEGGRTAPNATSADASAPGAFPPRKSSKIETDLAGLNFEDKAPPKPPRPAAPVAAAAPPAHAGVPTPISSGPVQPKSSNVARDDDDDDEDDPFGDENEI